MKTGIKHRSMEDVMRIIDLENGVYTAIRLLEQRTKRVITSYDREVIAHLKNLVKQH